MKKLVLLLIACLMVNVSIAMGCDPQYVEEADSENDPVVLELAEKLAKMSIADNSQPYLNSVENMEVLLQLNKPYRWEFTLPPEHQDEFLEIMFETQKDIIQRPRVDFDEGRLVDAHPNHPHPVSVLNRRLYGLTTHSEAEEYYTLPYYGYGEGWGSLANFKQSQRRLIEAVAGRSGKQHIDTTRGPLHKMIFLRLREPRQIVRIVHPWEDKKAE